MQRHLSTLVKLHTEKAERFMELVGAVIFEKGWHLYNDWVDIEEEINKRAPIQESTDDVNIKELEEQHKKDEEKQQEFSSKIA